MAKLRGFPRALGSTRESGTRPEAPAETTKPTFRRVPFPRERRLVLDTLALGRDKPMMHGLVEVDVTRARRLLREHRDRTGEAVSLTAFMLTCLGRAAGAHPEVHAMRDWRGRLVLFDAVDAATIVEVEVDGRRFALAHVVRNLQQRSVRDVHQEIRAVQSRGMRSLSRAERVGGRLLLNLPSPLRRAGYRVLLGLPELAQRRLGTILVSAVGMFGHGGGWGLSAPGLHDFSLVIGGIKTVRGSEAESREVLCLTVSANHELTDGAPLARFVEVLRDQVEGAALLADVGGERPPSAAPG